MVKPKPGSVELYDRINANSNAHILAASRAGRDIAPCPEVVNRRRRNASAKSLRKFLNAYFPDTFTLPWSDDHRRVIAKLERVISDGGQFALAMPRGSGKSSIVERAALWAVLTGRRRFVVIVAANESFAEQSLGRLKSELEHNDALLDDWPKATYPIRRLESQARRAVGQLCDGERTCIVWQRKRLGLPSMPGPDNEASGAVLHVAGLTGAIRGLSHVDTQGRTIRPDLVLVDDPQDRESAGSVVQTAQRLALLNGDLLGLAGPGERIAAMTTCTVIRPDDLADRLLDRERSPQWQGERLKLVYNWPTDEALWDEYAKIRTEELRVGDDGSKATAFYRSHRGAMDAGAVVAWKQRKNHDELSAIQHAVNLRLDRGDEFHAEYQNEPVGTLAGVAELDPVAIASRCSGLERGTAPVECEKATAFIDVGQRLLWWMVCTWSDDFSGSIIDYGAWPEQTARVFTSASATATLEQASPKAGVEGAVYAGLTSLVARLADRPWKRSDGASLPLSRVLIDCGWQTDTVRLAIRQNQRRDLLAPSKGFGVGPGMLALNDHRRHPGEKKGDGWILGKAGSDRLRLVRFDTNHWKSRVAGMLTRPMGTPCGITLPGDRPIDNELLALHLSSESPTPTTARGVTLDTWKRRPNCENHWFDCLVGCAVAASMEGATPLARIGGVQPERKRIRLSDLRRQNRR